MVDEQEPGGCHRQNKADEGKKDHVVIVTLPVLDIHLAAVCTHQHQVALFAYVRSSLTSSINVFTLPGCPRVCPRVSGLCTIRRGQGAAIVRTRRTRAKKTMWWL